MSFKMMSQVGHLWIMRKLLSSSLDGNIAVSAAIFYKLEQWDQIYHQPVSIFTKPEKWTINYKYVYFVALHMNSLQSLNLLKDSKWPKNRLDFLFKQELYTYLFLQA